MPLSHYPNGFKYGVNVRGLNIPQNHPGKVFWVNNSSAVAENGVGGSNNNDGTYQRPFSTIDYAIGKCQASRGDIIYVMPGHAETVATDGGIACDVAGISIIGLGTGSLRPTITVATLAAATVTVTAANVTLHNLVFLGNKNDLVSCLEIAGDSCEVSHCEFRESTNGMLSAITVGVADGDSDYTFIHDCAFYMDEPGITNVADAAIEIVFDHDHIRIWDNYIYGDFDDAGIHVPAAGNACDFLSIQRNYVENTASGAHAIEITTGGTMNGGDITDNRLVSDAAATLLEPHTLQCLGNRGSLGGTNYADFGIPAFGSNDWIPVVKAGGDPTAAADDLFDVTGTVEAKMWGRVTTTIAGGTAPEILVNVKDGSNTPINASTVITADAANTIYWVTGDPSDTLCGGATPIVGFSGTEGQNQSIILDDVTVEMTSGGTAAATAGVIEWTMLYRPMTPGASVAASA